MFTVSILQAQVHVNGYYKKDGTYVQPYYRTAPDGFLFNNYSYTHKLGQCIFTPDVMTDSPNQNAANAAATRDLQCMQMQQIAIENENAKRKQDNERIAQQLFQTKGINEASINEYGQITGDIETTLKLLKIYYELEKQKIEKDTLEKQEQYKVPKNVPSAFK